MMRVAMFVLAAAVMLTTAGWAQAPSQSNSKEVKLRIGAPTDIGGITLEPGDYTVQIAPDAAGTYLQFWEMVYDPYVQEADSEYQSELIAAVKAKPQDVGAPAASTQLMLSPADNTKATALEIRGNTVEYAIAQGE